MKKIFFTGTAGFIGFHLARLLLDEGFRVHGFDALTDYYDVTLKQRRHQMLMQSPNFSATETCLEDAETVQMEIEPFAPDGLCCAQAEPGLHLVKPAW